MIKKTSDQVSSSLGKLVRDRKSFHSQRIKLHHGLRKMRFLRARQRPPKQFQDLFGQNMISAPIAFRHVQTVVGAIAKHRPKYNLIMKNPGETDMRSEGERFHTMALQYFERKAKKPLYWKWVDSIVADSIGVLKFTRHAWEDYPEPKEDETEDEYIARCNKFLQGQAECPLRMRLVDPLTTLFPTYEWEPGDVLETGFRSIRDTLRQLRVAPIGGNLGALRIVEMGEPYPEDEVPNLPDAAVEVSELWTPNSVYVGMAGQFFEMENPYEGIIPYVITGGAPTSSSDPALEFISSLFPFQRLQPWSDMLITAMVAWAMSATNPVLATSRKPGPGITGSTETAIEDIPWGKNLDLGLGGEANFLTPPDVGNSIKGSIELMMTMMDRSSLSPAVSGYMGTRTAGLAMSSAVENALAMLIPTVDGMKVGLGDVAKMVDDFITKVIKAPVYVSGYEMLESNGYKRDVGLLKRGPKEVAATLDILVDIKRDSTMDEISKGGHAAFMRDKGLWSEERAMLYSGVDDVPRERKNILKDMARKHPIVQQYLAMIATSEEPPLAALMQETINPDTVQGPAYPGPTPFPGVGDMGPELQEEEAEPVDTGPAPRRGGRSAGTPSVGKRGPNQTNSPSGRRN